MIKYYGIFYRVAEVPIKAVKIKKTKNLSGPYHAILPQSFPSFPINDDGSFSGGYTRQCFVNSCPPRKVCVE